MRQRGGKDTAKSTGGRTIGYLPAGLERPWRPFDADLLGDLSVAYLEDMRQTHLAARAHGQWNKPLGTDFEGDDAVVHHPILGGEAVEAVPLDVLDGAKDLAIVVSHVGFALEPDEAAGGFPNHVIGVEING